MKNILNRIKKDLKSHNLDLLKEEIKNFSQLALEAEYYIRLERGYIETECEPDSVDYKDYPEESLSNVIAQYVAENKIDYNLLDDDYYLDTHCYLVPMSFLISKLGE